MGAGQGVALGRGKEVSGLHCAHGHGATCFGSLVARGVSQAAPQRCKQFARKSLFPQTFIVKL